MTPATRTEVRAAYCLRPARGSLVDSPPAAVTSKTTTEALCSLSLVSSAGRSRSCSRLARYCSTRAMNPDRFGCSRPVWQRSRSGSSATRSRRHIIGSPTAWLVMNRAAPEHLLRAASTIACRLRLVQSARASRPSRPQDVPCAGGTLGGRAVARPE